MKPCGPCGCNDRQAAYTVSFFSIGHFCLHLVAISIALAGEIQTNLSQAQLYGLLVYAIILVFMSILLFLGIRYDNKCLILPWLIMVIFADIGYCSTMIGTFVVLVSAHGHNDKNLGAFLLALFDFCIVTYLLWVIIRFFMDLFYWNPRPSSGNYQGLNNEDDADGNPWSVTHGPPPGKQKSNIVNKIFPHDNDY